MAKKIKGSFCEKKIANKNSFDSKSFRWKKSGKSWVLIGCPKGKWRRGHCSVGTRAYVVLAKSSGRCKTGRKIVK